MYKKAVQTPEVCAFAYEVPMGGYALCLRNTSSLPILEDEPDFESLDELELEMQKIAALTHWSEEAFICLTNRQHSSYS